MTYLTLINNVLKRLRESTVVDADSTTYSSLIGMFVNDAKQEVEQSWNWSALRTTLSATTSAGVFAYELTGSGDDLTILDVVNDTGNFFMEHKSSSEFNKYYLTQEPVPQGSPRYYTFNGLNSDGDTIMEVFPPPDGVYNIRFNIIDRTADLVENTDKLLVPSKPVEMLAYAKAIEERGEDGGITSSAAYAFAKNSLNNAIAFDAAKHPAETTWIEV
mgnify:CR=1 FL=1